MIRFLLKIRSGQEVRAAVSGVRRPIAPEVISGTECAGYSGLELESGSRKSLEMISTVKTCPFDKQKLNLCDSKELLYGRQGQFTAIPR